LAERAVGQGRVIAVLVYTVAAWGANVVVIKALTRHFEAVHLAALRTVVAFAFIALVAHLAAGFRPQRLGRRDILELSAAAFLMVYAHQILLTQGLMWSTATNGGLALSLNPLLSLLLGALLFGERLGATGVAGVVMGIAGAAFVILNRSGAELRLHGAGDALLFASMLVYVGAGAFMRSLSRRLSPVAIAWHMHWIGGVMLVAHAASLPAFWTAGAWDVEPTPWLLILASGLFSTALGGLGWSYGISRLGLGRTAVFLNLLPVSTLITAVLFLGEQARPAHALGFLLVLAGTWLAVNPRRAPAAAPAAP
jgi:drug/metabolite transporter (DMT)-like permease